MSLIQEQAVQMISLLPDDRVAVLIEVMKGFMMPVESMENHRTKSRIGIAKGKFIVPDDIDECNAEIAEMFEVNG